MLETSQCTLGGKSDHIQFIAVMNLMYRGAPEIQNCLVRASLFKYTLWCLHNWNFLTTLFSDVSLLGDAWLDYFLFYFLLLSRTYSPVKYFLREYASRHRAFSFAFWKCYSPPVFSALIFDYLEFLGTISCWQTSQYCSINIFSFPESLENEFVGWSPIISVICSSSLGSSLWDKD